MQRRAALIATAMALSVAAVTVLALWDASREADAALNDLAESEAMLAQVTGSAMSAQMANVREAMRANPSRLTVEPMSRPESGVSGSIATLAFRAPDRSTIGLRLPLQRLVPGNAWLDRDAMVLIAPPGDRRLLRIDGQTVFAPGLLRAMDQSRSWLQLSRAEAASLGLPARMAVAGLSIVRSPDFGDWGIAVVASARRERDRQSHARWRLILGVLLVSGLIVTFGGIALRIQRKEMNLTRALSVADRQRERDEQLAREGRAAMMVTLAAGVAHEISTPLSVIAGRAEQIQQRTTDERTQRAANAIVQQSDRIREVIHGFLRLARGDKPVLERVEPMRVADAAVQLVTHRFEKTGVLLTHLSKAELPAVMGNSRLLEQALVNLLLNACDACARGGHVDVRVEAAGGRVRFVVRDDGEGISPDAAARALEPFFTTKPTDKGTGLGLAIAHEIVTIHRGTLRLEARTDARGTIASFEIPTENGASDEGA